MSDKKIIVTIKPVGAPKELQGGNKMWKFETSEGTYNVFDEGWVDAVNSNLNAEWLLTLKQKGAFWNIKEFKMANELDKKTLSQAPKDVTADYPNANSGTGAVAHKQPDWDEIARGKVRSLFIQAHIQNNGMVKLDASEEQALRKLVEIAMVGFRDD